MLDGAICISELCGNAAPFFTSTVQVAAFSPAFRNCRAASLDLQKSLTVRLDLSYAKGLTALFRAQNLYAKGKQFKSLVRV